MKQTLLGILVLVLVACNDNTPATKPTGNDTTKTIVTYVHNANINDYRTSAAIRFAIDTLMPNPNDKTKNIVKRDTFYNVSVLQTIVDSTGAPIKGVNGDSVRLGWLGYTKDWILIDHKVSFENYLPKQ